MRKFLTCFFLTCFYAINVCAADDMLKPSRAAIISKTVVTETTPSRTAVSRNTISAKPTVVDASEKTDETTEESKDVQQVRGTQSTGISRAGVSRSTLAGDTSNARDNLEATVRNSGRNPRTDAASINSSAAARRAGVSFRPSTAEVGGRATIAGTNQQTGSNLNFNEARTVQSRSAATKETITEATERLQQTADLNKSCQLQYNDCMDQFCSVIDANQKRCSCSGNLSRYARSESAVKEANTQLNDVAQRIRYVGLSADEIRAIMSATEAEQVLDGSRDNTESRNMLLEIEKLIKNPSSTTSYSSSGGFGLDMDIDFSADATDLFNLDFLGAGGASFSNLRGAELYSAAKKRCSNVLTQCKNAGANTQQVTGNYDLAIDKDCIAYEKGLQKMNETLHGNVRSANQMLQKARLAVLQNKNMYDAKGCISALNTCMTDDMVCGSDYFKCLDPTKQYIDENGKVVLGQNVSNILKSMEHYDNSLVTKSFLSEAENANMRDCTSAGNDDGRCVVKYLLSKIGTGKTVAEGGLCRAVLDKCQYYTYSNNAYEPHNDVVLNYVQRAMVNIQSAQQNIISDYASSCMLDIAGCYNQQVSQVNTWSSTASTDSVYNVMRGACRNVALTCSYAVFAKDPASCPVANDTDSQNTCIDSVSRMFYQSLLCPDNSEYSPTKGTAGVDGYVNDRCICKTGYTPWGSMCARSCAPGTYRVTSTGICETCKAGFFCGGDPKAAEKCTAGNYCPAGSSAVTPCDPAKPNSPAGSSDANQCVP